MGERWTPRSIELVKFFPYKVPGDPTADEDIPEVVRLNPEEVEAAQQDADFKTFPRNHHIRKEELIRHGYTARCPGCMASIQGKRAQGHSRECRQRIEDEMKDHPWVLKAKERFTEALKEYMDLDEEKRVTKRSRFGEEGDFKIVRERHHDEEMTDDREFDSGASGSARPGLQGSFEESNADRKRVLENEEEEDQPLRRRLREKMATSSKRKHENDGEVDEPERKVFVNKFEVNQEFEEDWADTMDYFDDKTGSMLDGNLVKAAEKEELDFMEKLGVGMDSTEEECWRLTGKPPIDSKFAHRNKGSEDKQEIRARLVARDFKVKGSGTSLELFASTPPLEAKKMLFRQAVREGRS